MIREPMKQWMLKITKYADRLLEDLDELDWRIPSRRCSAIGSGNRRVPASFSVDGFAADAEKWRVTRPDTLFGATYLVVETR